MTRTHTWTQDDGEEVAVLRTRTRRATVDRFVQLAKRNGRSTASELRIAVDEHLKRHDAPERTG